MKLGRKLRNRPSYRTARKQWFDLNPANEYGYYECYICGFWVHKDRVSIDHYKPLDRSPELFNDITNFRPTHHKCNIWRSYNKDAPITRTDNYVELKELQMEAIRDKHQPRKDSDAD